MEDDDLMVDELLPVESVDVVVLFTDDFFLMLSEVDLLVDFFSGSEL